MADLSISNTVLRMVLAQANKEQNQHYPPSVFESHFSMTTHALIDEGAKIYPGTQSIMDLMDPYIKTILVQVINGVITVPTEYRHLLGFRIYIKEEEIPNTDKCRVIIPKEYDEMPENPSPEQLQALIAKAQSFARDVTTVSIGRWNKLTQHRYKRPKLDNPITCSFNTRTSKICPYEVPFVEISYILKTPEFKFGYLMNDDDTYYFDAGSTTEALWTENAISYLVKGVNTLYANYVRDPEQVQTAKDLRNSGLF